MGNFLYSVEIYLYIYIYIYIFSTYFIPILLVAYYRHCAPYRTVRVAPTTRRWIDRPQVSHSTLITISTSSLYSADSTRPLIPSPSFYFVDSFHFVSSHLRSTKVQLHGASIQWFPYIDS